MRPSHPVRHFIALRNHRLCCSAFQGLGCYIHYMKTTTISSRAFSQDTAGARRAAEKGPVFITEGSQPTHVLMTFARYRELTSAVSIIDMLAMPEAVDIDFEPAPLRALFVRELRRSR